MPVAATEPPDPRALVAGFERSVAATERRRTGVHYTPREVADAVLDLAFAASSGTPRRVCDPSCGAGAFLLAVADRLLALGVPPDEVVGDRLVGLELDPGAVAVARDALSGWASAHGARVDPGDVQVHQGDALAMDPGDWPGRPVGGFDLVVGNPPFLGQLSSRTARDAARRAHVARRFGPLGAYTDDAGVFLLAATELVGPGGVVALVQPQSLLSARDASTVRDAVLRRADLVALWAHGGTPFPGADVHVCAPVLRRRGPAAAVRRGDCEVVWQSGDRVHRSLSDGPADGDRWGALLAPALGVPDVPALRGAPLRSVAGATAGFRDEFYALCEAMVDDPAPVDAPGAAQPRLVTVGMIDPLQLRWGTAEHRLGGRRVRAPRVDPSSLEQHHPRVHRWMQDRLVPKVMVATQTRVIEAVADPGGDCVPVTPVISFEPSGPGVDVWQLVAALSAPPLSAVVVREHLGTGRSSATLRWSAAAALDAPLPVDERCWQRGASLARRLHEDRPDGAEREQLLGELAVVMTEAHGLAGDHPVVEWWSIRRPRR